MTALRQEALRMMDAMPEEGITALLQYMRDYLQERGQKAERIAKKEAALKRIEELSKPVPYLDEDMELTASREERFIHENFS